MKIAPQPKDVEDIIFKQSNINQILPNFTTVPKSCNFLVADGKRGLLYLGHTNSITIIKPTSDGRVEWKTQYNVPYDINRLALNCDCSYLAVTSQGPSAMIYDASTLSQNLELLHDVRLSSNNVETATLDFCWNPTVPGVFCTISTDHTIGSFQITQEKKTTIGVTARERLNNLDVLCAAWSPKGKQIVVGCKDGCIVQLKPDLKIMRSLPGPNPGIGEVISILWLSNYQFCAAYYQPDEQRINVLIIDAPKGESLATFTCYEDITFGTPGEETNPQRYYFEHIAEWGVILAGSSRSSEIAILCTRDNGTSWEQWIPHDSSRVQLPFNKNSMECYPVGLALDKTTTKQLPWTGETTLPNPVPILNILGTSGQLCSFHMINLIPNCPGICNPPVETVQPPPVQLQPDKSFAMTIGATSTPKKEEKPKPVAISIKLPLKQESKPVEKAKPLEPEKTTITDTNICLRAIFERTTFEKELKSRLEPREWNCGSQEESQLLADKSLSVEQFLTELTDTTNSLSNDIAVLKALLLRSYAWVEETRSKNLSIDTNLKSCNLERSNKFKQLKTFNHYIESQLYEANKILDANWSKSKNQEEMRMKIPSLEYVYQTISLHQKIINREKTSLEELKKKLQQKTGIKINENRTLDESFSKLNLTTTIIENPSIIETKCKSLAMKTLSFTEEKEIKLRNLLLETSPMIIRPMDTTVIHDRLEATLKSLATPTIVAKPPIQTKIEPVLKPTVVTSPPPVPVPIVKEIVVPTPSPKPMFPIILKTVDTTIKLPKTPPVPVPSPITIPTVNKPLTKSIATTSPVIITLTNPIKTIATSPKTPFSGFSFTPTTTTSAITTPMVTVTATIAPTTTTVGNFMDGLMLSSPPKTTTAPLFETPVFKTRPGNLFGNVSSTPPVEMSMDNNVFGKVSTTGNLFGQQTTQAQTTQSPMFGSSGGSNIFGGGNNVFGSRTNFPTSPVFNTNSTSFGGDSTSVFGSPQPAFGQQQGGQQSQQPQQPAFGGKPVFGSPSSVFGGGTGSGGPPANTFGSGFGGAATFGTNSLGFGNMPVMNSGNKVFGGTTVGNPTFEHLAGQSGSLTFGSLAQTNPEPQKPPAFPG